MIILRAVKVFIIDYVFVTKYFLDLHCWDKLKNFATIKLLWLVIKFAYYGPRNWLVMYLGAMHQKEKFLLQNKSN